MTAEPRDVEEITGDLAHERPDPSCGCVTFGCARCMADSAAFRAWRNARKRLAADVEPLLARLAAADRENAELRGEVERLRSLPFWAGRWVEMDLAARWKSERNEARAQLAAAQAQLADAVSKAIRRGDRAGLAEARIEAVRGYVAKARATESTDHAAGWNLALTAVANRVAALSAAPQPEPDDTERQAMEADAMREPSPSAMLAGIHVTRYQPQDCACRGKHEHRYGYTRDCTVRDCTCSGSPEPPASDAPARCEHDWDFMQPASTCRHCGAEWADTHGADR